MIPMAQILPSTFLPSRSDILIKLRSPMLSNTKKVKQPRRKWVKESMFPHIPVKGQFPSLLVQLEACKASMGIGMLPCFLGDNEPSLKRLSPPEFKPNFDLWLLIHGDLRKTARFRVFSDFIASTIKSQRHVLEGR
ncbi:MAG: LysR family transcriptional regulator [Proteobacteria bacterium]|nr:LysR family transcriptional regulator [Pseudomonadota bacterium]